MRAFGSVLSVLVFVGCSSANESVAPQSPAHVASAKPAETAPSDGSADMGPGLAAPAGTNEPVVEAPEAREPTGPTGSAKPASVKLEQGCPVDSFAALGVACAEPGKTCGAEKCKNAKGFCNIVTCERGVWSRIEVPPMPPSR